MNSIIDKIKGIKKTEKTGSPVLTNIMAFSIQYCFKDLTKYTALRVTEKDGLFQQK